MSPNLLLSSWPRPSDTLPPPLAPGLAMQLTDADSSFNGRQKEDKFPHDASVFVGSLPSNIDQGDLTRMLMEHLSEHTQIKNIKVVRDSKGGVCAFVQCENAISAASLIHTLHSSVPKPFLGRVLRYEPARAFRSLLISYRTPTQFVRSHVPNAPASINSEIQLDLPTTMRIWKHGTSRFHSILYNSEAVRAEKNCDRSVSDAPLLDSILFLHPLTFDEETLVRLSSYFGPLEKVVAINEMAALNLHNASHDGRELSKAMYSYPEPHCAPRSASMDTSCWEIKWEHRDDCVSALMTLRRVPHLTVTWAHQPAPFGQMNQSNDYHQNLGSTLYSLHTVQHPLASHFHPSQSMRPADSQKLGETKEETGIPDLAVKQQAHSLPNPSSQRERESNLWAETIIDYSRAAAEKNGPAFSQQIWVAPSGEEHNGETSTDSNDSPEAGVQELYMPPTPALDSLSITPVTGGSQFPITPTSSTANISPNIPHEGFGLKESSQSFKGHRPEREIDPTTLFVGGLEMYGPRAWDEEKVRVFFSRFGGLESVKVVRPMNACAAFAFVKFDNAEAPARAVFEEHNRVYEGRAMRVQLRDCNPPRNSWKFGRGRGRSHHHHFNGPRKLNHRPSFGGQERVPFNTNNDKSIANIAAETRLSSHADALPAKIRGSRDDISSATGSTAPSSDDSSASGNTPSTEKYREWYDDPETPTRTPEPSSLGSSVSITGVSFSGSPYPYPLPNGPFLPPPPWMNPYSPHGPYQMPYYQGYPIYPPPAPLQPHQMLNTPPGSDVGGPTTPGPHNWPPLGMYTSYIPYPAFASRTQLAELGQSLPQQLPSQAPVVPTGFIQNEQGTLIAIYQPEVLDQYLAGSGPPPLPMGHPLPPPNRQRWDFNNHPQMYEHGNPPPNAFIRPAPNQNRMKPFPIPPSHYQNAAPMRRDNQHNGSLRQHQGRSINHGRPARGQPVHIHANQGHHIVAQPGMPGDRNKWNGAR